MFVVYRSPSALFLGASVIALSLTFSRANAQDEEFVLDTVVITGERVERSVFETPSSVVAVQNKELEDTPAIQNVEDVLEDIPNIVVFGGSNEAPVIRGQQTGGPLSGAASFLSGTLPRATITIDGRALSSNEYIFGTSSVYDVNTIEVFRGPQTTSQGTNSIAGAIYITTNDPTYEYEASARGQVQSFDGYQLSGMANVPIIADELAIRGVIDFRRRDTYIDYRTPGQNLIDENFDVEQLTGRAKLLWQPKALPGLTTKVTYSHTDTSSPQTELVDEPFSDLARTTNTDPSAFTTKANTIIHDLEYALSDQVAFKNRFYWSGFDIERLVADPDQGAAEIDGDDFTNETLLNFDLMDGRLTGVAGLYLRWIDEDDVFQFSGSLTEINDRKTALGVFTEFTYRFTEKFDATAGVRYQRDRQERTGIAFGGAPFAVPVDFDETFDAFLPKFAVGYNVTEDIRVGGIVSRGFNPGGTNLSFSTIFGGQPNPFFDFDEETLWNYELFARANLLNNRLFLAANLFFTDFDDTQRETTTILPNGIPDTVVENAEDAQSYGFEVSANFQATDRLRVFGGFGLLFTEFESFGASTANLEGNEFRGAPTFTGNIGFDAEVIDNLFFGAKARYVDDYFSDDTNLAANEVDGYAIVDLKASFEPNENIKVFGFINNLFDEVTPVNIFTAGAGRVATTTVPREFGIGAQITF